MRSSKNINTFDIPRQNKLGKFLNPSRDIWFLKNFTIPLFIIVAYAYLVYSLIYTAGYPSLAQTVTIAWLIITSVAYFVLFQTKLISLRWLLSWLSSYIEWSETRTAWIIGVVTLAIVLFLNTQLSLLKPIISTQETWLAIIPMALWAMSARSVINCMVIIRLWNRLNLLLAILFLTIGLWLMLLISASLLPSVFHLACSTVIGVLGGQLIGQIMVVYYTRRLASRNASIDTPPIRGHEASPKTPQETQKNTSRYRMYMVQRRLITAVLFLLFSPSLLFDRLERTISLCRLFLILGRYKGVLRRIKKYNGRISGRLVSLKGLATAGLGDHDAACEIFTSAPDWESNPYYLINKSIMAYHLGRYEEAFDLATDAAAIVPSCDLAQNNKAYFMTEYAINRFKGDIQGKPLIDEAHKIARKVLLKNKESRRSATYQDTYAYIGLVKRDETLEDEALKILSWAMLVNDEARYHLAIAVMTRSRSCWHAEYLLQSVLRKCRMSWKKRLFDLAALNLAKIDTARTLGMMFEPEAILYHHHDFNEMPDTSYQRIDSRTKTELEEDPFELKKQKRIAKVPALITMFSFGHTLLHSADAIQPETIPIGGQGNSTSNRN